MNPTSSLQNRFAKVLVVALVIGFATHSSFAQTDNDMPTPEGVQRELEAEIAKSHATTVQAGPTESRTQVVPLSPPPPNPAGPAQAYPTPNPAAVRPQPVQQQPQQPQYQQQYQAPPQQPQYQPQQSQQNTALPSQATVTEQTSQIIDAKPVSDITKRKVTATVRTSMGSFTIRLLTRQAPRTTQHFIDLAKGDKEFVDAKTGQKIRRPFYNGLIFHRVIKGFVIQGGCPLGNGTQGPGFTIPDEITPALRFRRAGMVAMALANDEKGNPIKDSNGSQFFITLAPQPDFDDKYTIFGEVTQGMDVVKDISRLKVGPTNRPIKRVTIIGIDIHEQ